MYTRALLSARNAVKATETDHPMERLAGVVSFTAWHGIRNGLQASHHVRTPCPSRCMERCSQRQAKEEQPPPHQWHFGRWWHSILSGTVWHG